MGSWKAMPMAKVFLFVVATLVGKSSAQAEVSLLATTGGYFGRYSAGVVFNGRKRVHRLSAAFGITPDDEIKTVKQITLAYTYSPWRIETDNWTLRPVQMGAFLTGTTDSRFFIKVPDRYRDPFYYEQISIRPGFTLGASIETGALEAGAFLSLLDQGVQQALNNGLMETMEDFVSLGFAINVHFQ